MEFESVGDYNPATIRDLKWMPQHDYLLHILALKKRSDKIQAPDKSESGW